MPRQGVRSAGRSDNLHASTMSMRRACNASLSDLAPLSGCLQGLRLPSRLPFGGKPLSALTALTALHVPEQCTGLSHEGCAAAALLTGLRRLTLSSMERPMGIYPPGRVAPAPATGDQRGQCASITCQCLSSAIKHLPWRRISNSCLRTCAGGDLAAMLSRLTALTSLELDHDAAARLAPLLS